MNGDDMILGLDEADVLGAVRRGRPGVTRGGGRTIFGRSPLPIGPRPEVRPDSIIRSAIGFGLATWAPLDGADKTLVVEPQESFRGQRLVIERSESGGTFTGQILLRRMEIGTQPQSPSVEQPMPATMFRADATEANLDWQIAYAGTRMQLTLGVSAAPAAGITVVAAVGAYGEWIR